MSPEPGQRYRFGPRERGGGIAGWRTGQIVTVAIGLLLGVLTLRWQPDAAGVAAAIVILVVSGALATVPVAGRTGDEWLPVTVCWAARRAGWPGGRALGALRGVRLLETGWRGMGVVHDRKARTLTAALALARPQLRPPRRRRAGPSRRGLVLGPGLARRERALRFTAPSGSVPPFPTTGVACGSSWPMPPIRMPRQPARRPTSHSSRTSTSTPARTTWYWPSRCG